MVSCTHGEQRALAALIEVHRQYQKADSECANRARYTGFEPEADSASTDDGHCACTNRKPGRAVVALQAVSADCQAMASVDAPL